MQTDRRTVLVGSMAATLLAEQAQAGVDLGNMHGSSPPPLKGLLKKGYADSTWGQIHYRHVLPAGKTSRTPIAFFHPNPFSAAYFNYTLEELGTDRHAIAFDTPGYGESARPPEPQRIEALATAFATALENMGYGPRGKGKVDLSGFHTGAYIASEMAAARPDLVRRVVLSGVPFWEGDVLEQKRRELLVDKPLTEDGAFVQLEWNTWAAHRNKLIPLDRGLELVTQAIIPGQQIWWAYYGVIEYKARTRFPKITQPVLLVVPDGEALAVTTRAVLPLLQKGKILEVPQLPHQIFDLAVPAVGVIYRNFLNSAA